VNVEQCGVVRVCRYDHELNIELVLVGAFVWVAINFHSLLNLPSILAWVLLSIIKAPPDWYIQCDGIRYRTNKERRVAKKMWLKTWPRTKGKQDAALYWKKSANRIHDLFNKETPNSSVMV
jgi:hypothetical protein